MMMVVLLEVLMVVVLQSRDWRGREGGEGGHQSHVEPEWSRTEWPMMMIQKGPPHLLKRASVFDFVQLNCFGAFSCFCQTDYVLIWGEVSFWQGLAIYVLSSTQSCTKPTVLLSPKHSSLPKPSHLSDRSSVAVGWIIVSCQTILCSLWRWVRRTCQCPAASISWLFFTTRLFSYLFAGTSLHTCQTCLKDICAVIPIKLQSHHSLSFSDFNTRKSSNTHWIDEHGEKLFW